MKLLPGSRCGSYEIVQLIGEGGMGSVYRANDTRLGRQVALKLIRRELLDDPASMARFGREARLLASLNHPHIATIHGIEESEGEPFLVLELVQGATLAERLAHGPLPVRESLVLAAQIATAIEAAHAQGIIHRDLKPANIKVTPDGSVKVLDFGLAKALAPDPPDQARPDAATIGASRTGSGVVLGTASYMSPEQARGEQVDERTDIWAFGCVLYDMLTGKPAFEGATSSDTIAAILTRDPDWSSLPADLPAPVRCLLRRALMRDSFQRLRDIGDARIEIEEALAAPSGVDATPSGTRDTARSVGLDRRWLAGGVLVVAALAAATGWIVKPSGQEPGRPTVQFAIPVPRGQHLDGLDFPAVAVSPDGTHVAFCAGSGGAQQLFVRALSGLEAQPLAGTEGALSPFFSPDGQWIGFFAAGKLKKVQVSGGPVLAIQEAAIGFGGVWTTGGTIIYAPDNGSALWEVSADGGAPRAITKLNTARGEFSHRWPELLPGDAAVLYTVGTEGSWDDAEIVVQSIKTGERHTVVQGGTDPKYLRDGTLLFARGGAVLAVPFDPRALRATGSAITALSGVLESSDGAMELGASRNGTIAYIAGGAGGRALVWVDRQGIVQPLASPTKDYASPRVSPDERTLAMAIAGTVQEDIWTYDISKNALTRITTEGGNSPVWSSDGERIIFSASRGGRPNLFWKKADGEGADERLTTSSLAEVPTSSSSVGRRTVAYVETDPNHVRYIVLFDPVDRTTRRFHNPAANESAAAFSPDGKWMALVSDQTGRDEVYITAVDNPKQLTKVSADGGSEPVWRRDGKELFFRSGERMMAAAVTLAPALAIQPPRVLFRGTFDAGTASRPAYDVSGDGSRFLMVVSETLDRQTNELRVVLGWTARPAPSR